MALPVFDIIAPTTAAKTSAPFDATDADSITVSADNLAGTEKVTIFAVAGDTNVVVALLDGTQVFLTVTLPALALEGGISYVFQKPVTAGVCGVYVTAKNA